MNPDQTKSDALAVIEPTDAPPNGNGHRSMVATNELPIAKYVTNEQKIAEEKFLEEKEEQVQRRYTGVRGYFRILHVSLVLGKLALYLYLDQLDVHRSAQLRHAKERMIRAQRLTRAAVYGEYLHSARLWFFHRFMMLVRLFVLGRETNREAIQEKQAVWLKEKLIEL